MPGKGARAKSKLKRLQQKRNRKAINQALYESYKKAGTNRKTNRSGRRGGKAFRTTKHNISHCGNLACSRCYPYFNDPLKAPKGSVLFGRGEYLRFLAKNESDIKVEVKQ